jgi:hypothetical protein
LEQTGQNQEAVATERAVSVSLQKRRHAVSNTPDTIASPAKSRRVPSSAGFVM